MRLLALVLMAWLAAGHAVAQPAPGSPPVMMALMGKRLSGPAGEELGRLVDIVVDGEGRPLAVVVDVGGFMGLGMRRVALAWGLLRFRAEPETVRLSVEISPERVTAAPEYRPGDPASILSLPASQ